MPAAATTNGQSAATNGGSGVAQLDHILASFTTLTDPLAINDALLVIEHSLQGIICYHLVGNLYQSAQEISSKYIDIMNALVNRPTGNSADNTKDPQLNPSRILLHSPPTGPRLRH